jgi:hypothetical protein
MLRLTTLLLLATILGRTAVATISLNNGHELSDNPGIFSDDPYAISVNEIHLPHRLTRGEIGEVIVFQLKADLQVSGVIDSVSGNRDFFSMSGSIVNGMHRVFNLSHHYIMPYKSMFIATSTSTQPQAQTFRYPTTKAAFTPMWITECILDGRYVLSTTQSATTR